MGMPGIGEVVGDAFRLEALLGRGGHGVVYSAVVEAETAGLAVGTRVAVKMLRHKALDNAVLRGRMLREAELVSQLRSPHTVRVYHHGTHEADAINVPFLVCELLEGETLGERLVGGLSIDSLEAVEILRQTLLSLAEAHEQGIIHRDIKPGNIFLLAGAQTRVKVLDFGVAKPKGSASEGLTSAGTAPGTVAFMAPEQAMGRDELTPAADVYSVGCVAYRMLAGRLPYSGRSPLEVSIKHVSSPLPALPRALAEHEIGGMVRRALEKEVADRYPDARAFLDALPDTERVATVVHVPSVATVITRTAPSELTEDVLHTATSIRHAEATATAPAVRPARPRSAAWVVGLAGGAVLTTLFIAVAALGIVQWTPDSRAQPEPALPAPPARIGGAEVPIAPVDPWVRPRGAADPGVQGPVAAPPVATSLDATSDPNDVEVPAEPALVEAVAPEPTRARPRESKRRKPRKASPPAATMAKAKKPVKDSGNAQPKAAKSPGPKIDLFKKKD